MIDGMDDEPIPYPKHSVFAVWRWDGATWFVVLLVVPVVTLLSLPLIAGGIDQVLRWFGYKPEWGP